MNTYETALLLTCSKLMTYVAANEPGVAWVLSHAEWADEMAHGPRYAVGRWFGPVHERDRMRYRRAIEALEEQGLLTTWRREGLRLSHIKLTTAGVDVARQLGTEVAVDG